MIGGRMDTLVERAEEEIVVKKSRFIAIALPTTTLEEVKQAVDTIRKEHPDANHVVHASVVGKAGTVYSSSDDKEPKNTAGRPALEVLKGRKITNITVCIVRYFGGTLLGTGGLVKAYGDSCKAVLEKVRTEELVEKTDLVLCMGYEHIAQAKRIFQETDAMVLEEEFGTAVKIRIRILKDNESETKRKLMDLGQGRITVG